MIKYAYPYVFKNNHKPQQPIIFCHGFNSSEQRFNIFADYWKENDFYAIAFPGNNELEPVNGDDVSVPGFADLLIKFIKDNNLKNVILIGHSMGGGTIALAYKKRPDLFSKMVFIAPMNRSSLVAKDAYFHDYFPKTFDVFIDFLGSLYYDVTKFTKDEKWMEVQKKLFDPYHYNNPTILKLGKSLPDLKLMDKIDEGLEAINVPTLLILGEKDGVIDRDNCLKYYKEHVKDVQTEWIPKTGHLMYEENWDAFINILSKFLKAK